jgi:hypothetical protein
MNYPHTIEKWMMMIKVTILRRKMAVLQMKTDMPGAKIVTKIELKLKMELRMLMMML